MRETAWGGKIAGEMNVNDVTCEYLKSFLKFTDFFECLKNLKFKCFEVRFPNKIELSYIQIIR